MRHVLAVEADGKQADILRLILDRQPDTQLVVVRSAHAATVTINRRAPDLLLLSSSLTRKVQESVETHFRSVTDAPDPLVLRIPPLGSSDARPRDAKASRFQRTRRSEATRTDLDAFSEEISACLARVETRHSVEEPDGRLDCEPVHAPPMELLDTPTEPEERRCLGQASTMSESDTDSGWRSVSLDSALNEAPLTSGEAPIDPEVHYAELALVRAQTEAQLATELARVREEADAAHAAELARVRTEAAQQLLEELEDAERLRVAAVEQARLAAEKALARALEAEAGRVQAEAEARLQAELARVGAEAEQAQLATAEAQGDIEKGREAAARALDAEVARAQAEAEAGLHAALTRERDEADARLRTELDRMRAHVEEARAAGVQTQIDLERAREAAVREACAAADEAAARAFEVEVTRVRAEADSRLQTEVERERADAEVRLQAELKRERAEADARLRTDLDHMRTEVEEAREAAVREASAAAKEAAAHAFNAEVARVQAQADARLHAELERVRTEADARLQAEQARLAAEKAATHTLETTVARLRADAEARLAPEAADLHAAAERHRAAALAEIQAQFALAGEHARSPVSAAARAAALGTTAARTAARAAARAAVVVLFALAWCWRTALPTARDAAARVPSRALLVAAMLVLAALGAALVDLPSLLETMETHTAAASRTASTVFADTARTIQASLSTDSPTDAESTGANVEPSAAPAQTAPAPPGMLAVFSRIPLELYASGRRIGTTEDSRIVLASGRYQIVLVSTRFNYRGAITLDVQPGAVTSHTVALPDGLLEVQTEPGAEIWIEGERAGVAPVGALPVPIGTREVVARHGELGERRQVVEVRYGVTTSVAIDLRMPGGLSQEAFPLPPLARTR